MLQVGVMAGTDSETPGSSPTARRLPAGRKATLANYVNAAGEVTVAELAERFGVSSDTIRRDLVALDAEGILIRTHGGAVSASAVPRPDTGLDVRMRLQTEAKAKIAARAAQLVSDGDAVIINAGTTTLGLTRSLGDHKDLTIATNSVRLAAELSPSTYRDLYLFGGVVRPSAQATIGPLRFAAWADGSEVDVRASLAIVAVGGVAAEVGHTTSNVAEASMMAEMMDRADRVAVVADSSKFGRRLFATVASLARPDYFITDTRPPTEIAARMAEGGCEVLVAD